jgi:hypothetical protein
MTIHSFERGSLYEDRESGNGKGTAMKRTLSVLLAVLLAAANLLTGCSMLPGAASKDPFTLSYATNAGNIDFFLNNDDFDTIMMSGPFYPGSRQLPSQNTAAYDTARANKVASIVGEAQKLVAGLEAAKPALADLRGSYISWLDIVLKEEPKVSDFAMETARSIALQATMEAIAEAEFLGMAEQKPTKAFATSMQQVLMVAKANELAGMYVKEVNDIGAYAALGLEAFANSSNAKITAGNTKLDAAMNTQIDAAVKALEPIAESVGVIDVGMKQLAAGDYLMAKEASGWTTAEMAKLKPVVEGLQPREGITDQDVADMKAYYQAFEEWKISLDGHFESMDATGISQAPAPGGGTWQWGPKLAWAAEGGYTPGSSYNQAVSTLNTSPEPKPGWLASGWGLIKAGFGNAKTAIGVTVDTLGSTVRTTSAVACGLYYGNSFADVVDNSVEGAKAIVDNYKNGTSGSSTFKQAGQYIDDVEKGSGEWAGWAAKGLVTKTLGKGKVADGVGWVADGLVKNTTGMFTGLAKGFYKVADKGSSTADVAGGFVDIALSAVGGSKIILKGSQVPGLLKGGYQGFKNAGKAVLSLTESSANKVAQGKLEAEIAKLAVAKGLTAAEAKNLLSNRARLEIQAAVGQFIQQSRDQMIKRIRDLIASGGTTLWANFWTGSKGSLKDLLVETFPKSLRGFLDAGTKVMGKDAVEYLDNLIGGQLDPLMAGIINAVFAIPPDPGQMNGEWAATLVITQVDLPPGAAESAKKQGCDIDLSKLVGQKVPGTLDLSLNSDGSGRATYAGKGSAPVKGPATYSGGKLTMSFSANKATISMQGNAALAEKGVDMSGGFSMSAQGSPIKISGTWTATKVFKK